MLLPRQNPLALLFLSLCLSFSLPAQDEEPIEENSIEALLQAGAWEEVLPLVVELEREWHNEVGRTDKEEHRLQWAQSLVLRGMVETRLNKVEESLKNLNLALDLAEEAKANPFILAQALDALGRAESFDSNYPAAEKALKRAVATLEPVRDQDPEDWYTKSRDHLGLLYLRMGRYREAGRIFHENLETTSDDPKARAKRHGYLGKYFIVMESYRAAIEHLHQAREIALAEWGPDHDQSLVLSGQLGWACVRLSGMDAEAERYLREAIRGTQAQSHAHVRSTRLATYFNNLAQLATRKGDHESALATYEEVLKTLAPRLGDDTPMLATFYNNIGYANLRLNRLKEAEAAFHEASVRYAYSVGTRHRRYIESKLELAETRLLAQEDSEDLKSELRETLDEALDFYDYVVSFGTERQRLNLRQQSSLFTLPCSLGDPELIANTLLRSKGLVLESLVQDRKTVSESLLQEYQEKRRKLDDLLFRFESPDHLVRLRDEVRAIETKLLAAERDTGESSTKPTWQAIQATLPPRSAWIDFVRYENLKAGPQAPPSYGALLLLPDGPPRWIPLGTEEELNIWLGVMNERLEYRTHVLNGREAAAPAFRLKTALRSLYDLFWAPLAKELPGDTETIGLSPDHRLNSVSFAVLLDGDNKFLAQRYRQLVYTGSARDLLLDQTRPRLTEGPWNLITVPEFEAAVPGKTAPESDNDVDQKVRNTISSLSSLPGAAEELDRIERILPKDTRRISLVNATEQDVRSMRESPVVLHLSTHSFLLESAENMPDLQDFDEWPEQFYRSGLVLTESRRALSERGQGKTVPFERDGILFSDEVQNLPLQNTRLVTLSSCSSGLGESVSGEGIHGLRRGFTLAGAENIIMSLWPVSDSSTPKFMEQMYQLSLATEQIGQSLWETQRRTIGDVDPDDDAELEEAVLRYGCFVLTQRGPLQPAVEMPEIKERFEHWTPLILALGGILIFIVSRPRKRRTA